MASRTLIAYGNRIDEAVLSGGSWMAALPLTNLQNRVIAKVARSSNATLAATQFDLNLGRARRIGMLSLIGHNLTVLAKVRVRGDDASDFATPLYDSGWVDVWPSGMIPPALLEWEEDNFWLGTLSDQARAGYQSPFIHRVLGLPSLQYWRVEIDDSSNSDGYVHIGRAFLADVWQPERGPVVGAAIGVEDQTPVESSLGGSEYFDARAKPRLHRFDLRAMPKAEAYSRVLDLQNLLGIAGEILIDPDYADLENKPRRAFVGRLRSLSPVVESSTGLFDTSFEIREVF